MTFLAPAMLFGLLAVGLPIAIHLLTRPRLRQIRWAATRFLIKSVQKNRRRLQAEDLFLLILRCLLVALLVLIFARPALLTDAAGPQLGDGVSNAVILLDDSASMGQSDGVQTRFDQAKAMAEGILSKLGPGSSAALFLVADRTKALIPKPTQDLAIVRRALTQAVLTDRGTDLYPGLKAAFDLLKGSTGAHREIFLLTDSQLSAWSGMETIRRLQDENKKDIDLHVLVVGEKGEDNLAVSDLRTIGTVVAVNQPLRCAVTVSNWGREAVEKIPVRLAADDAPPQDEAMIDRIEPGASRTVNLFARFRDPGYHSLTAGIPGDRLPSDNQRSLALFVLEQIRALVVEGTANPDPSARDGFFLRHALLPVRPDQIDPYYMKVKVGQVDDLESTTIGQYELVFLSNVAQLTPLGAQTLQKYVQGGGALVVFPGPVSDLGFYNDNPVFSALLPAKLGPAIDAPSSQKFLGWQSRDYRHPVTDLWNDPASGNLGSVRVSHYFPLSAKAAMGSAPAPEVVVQYADGEPAVMEQAVGKGRVFLFSNTATTAWTSLPIHPAFVPLLMRIVAYATGGSGGQLALAPGRPFAFDVDSEIAGQQLSVQRPDDKKRRIAGRVETGEHSAQIRYTDTERAGVYQLYVGDDPKPKVVFAVQGDPAESNLAQEPKDDLAPLSAAPASAAGVASAAAPTTQTGSRHLVPGLEIWYPLAIAALLLALLETALAHRFSQAK